MKKLIALILSLTFVLALVGCANDENADKNAPNPNPNSEIERTNEPDTYPPIEIVPNIQLDEPVEVEPVDYPPMVMFNDILYTATSYSGDKNNLIVVGKIEHSIDNGIPTENNQANDLLVGCEIYTTVSAPDFIFVLNNGVYSPYKSTDGTGIE